MNYSKTSTLDGSRENTQTFSVPITAFDAVDVKFVAAIIDVDSDIDFKVYSLKI